MPRKTTDLKDTETLEKSKKATATSEEKKAKKTQKSEKVEKTSTKTTKASTKAVSEKNKTTASATKAANKKTNKIETKTKKEVSTSTKKASVSSAKKSSSVSKTKKDGKNSSLKIEKSEKKLFSKDVNKKDVETTLNKIKEILSTDIKKVSIKTIKELLSTDITDILNSDVRDVLSILLEKKSTKKSDKKVSSVISEDVPATSIVIGPNGKISVSKTKSNKKLINKSLVTKEFKPEYYDLPYRYNETIVKILAQTPKKLFIYWDISDKDIESFRKTFGENFFNTTYPILLVHNIEKNYTFEVQINDFANSWYIDINDPKCTYKIELGRKFKETPQILDYTDIQNKTINLQNDYLCITTSNHLEVPNDHILFEEFKPYVTYRNVKTMQETAKNIESLPIAKKINKIYNIYDFYKEIYTTTDDENFEFDFANPSSGNPTSSSFK